MNHLTPRFNRDIFNRQADFFDHTFDRLMGAGSTLSTDIIEKEDGYELSADLPGVEKDNINIDYNDNVLTIQADQSHSTDIEDKDAGQYIRRERSHQSFSRTFVIPNIIAEDIKARFDNGVLTIHLPKKDESKNLSHQIEIE